MSRTKDFFAHGHCKSRALRVKIFRGFFVSIRSKIFLERKSLAKTAQAFFAGGKPPDPQRRSGYALGIMPFACLHLVAVKFFSVATSKISTQQKYQQQKH